MREHRSTSLFITLVFLMGLAGCVADSTKSPSDTVASSAVVQAEEGKDQPPSGEIQERAVPGPREPRVPAETKPQPVLPPRQMAPGVPAPAPGPPPPQMVPGVFAPSPYVPSPMKVLPGEFVIQTYLKGNYLTALNGGGQSGGVESAIQTYATQIGPWEKFRLWNGDPLNPQYIAFQTLDGHWVYAIGGGGQPTYALATDRRDWQDFARFRLGAIATRPPPYAQNLNQYNQYFGQTVYAIQTVNAHYFLTAVGGGGKTTDAVHTDATKMDTWEYFSLQKCGDLGSGYQYYIIDPTWYHLAATDGGGHVLSVFYPLDSLKNFQRFTLIQQGDGSYAIQTSNGINYVTAIRGGGLAHGEPTWDNLVTDRTQVQAWETFRIVDQGDCSYTIQTVSGFYLGPQSPPALGGYSTRISNINSATKFRLQMWGLAAGG